MSNRRRKQSSSRLIAILSVAQLVAGIALLIAALTYASRPTCAQVLNKSTGATGLLSLLAHTETNCVQVAGVVATTQPVAAVPATITAPAEAAAPITTATPTRAPTATSAPTSLINEVLAPFKDEAQRRRTTRALRETNYSNRVDSSLNTGRINFLFFGFGETYEPPYPPDYKGSINIFSLDLKSLSLSTVTLNHDIRAPEVERYRQNTDRKKGPTKIDQSYPVGGFEVMRATVEDATGVSVDFQLAMDDGVIKRAVDGVFGGVDVFVPFDFDALPVYFDGVKYPDYHYAKGTQKMDGLHAVQFIKAVYEGPYDATRELTVRKQIIIKAMLDATKKESLNPLFWTKALGFLRSEIDRKGVVFDFDATTLIMQSIQNLVFRAAQGAALTLPSVGQSVYVVDRRSGDGGVEWVTGSTNPIMQRDLEDGVYADKSMSVPMGSADPYADDLVADYWTSVRALIKDRLSP